MKAVFYSRDPDARERNLNDFLGGISIAEIDKETCKVFGRERGRLRAKKKAVADFDLLIGATDLRQNVTFLTNNRRHFEMIEGLRIESVGLPTKRKVPRSQSGGCRRDVMQVRMRPGDPE